MKHLKFLFSFISALFALNLSVCADLYSDTTLLNARDIVNERLLKETEQRKIMSTVIDCFLESTGILNPTLVQNSVTGQTAQLMYNKNKDFTVNAAFSCSPSGEQGGSGIATVSFVDKTVVGLVSKTQAAAKVGGYAGILANELYNMEKTLLFSAIPSYIITNVLEALKSTVNDANAQPNIFNVDTMEVAKDDVKRFYSLLRSDMAINDYDLTTQFYDICNTSFKALHNEFNFGGISNVLDRPEDNNIKQFLANGLTVGAAYSSTHYAIPAGAAYFVSRVPVRFDGENRGTYIRMPYNSMLLPGVQLVLTKFMS